METSSLPSFDKFFIEYGIEHTKHIFIENGFKTVLGILSVSDTDLKEMEIKSLGMRRDILAALANCTKEMHQVKGMEADRLSDIDSESIIGESSFSGVDGNIPNMSSTPKTGKGMKRKRYESADTDHDDDSSDVLPKSQSSEASRDSCKEQVNGYSNAEYKSFNTASEARAFASGENSYGGSSYGGHSSRSYGGGGGQARVYTDGACTNNGQYGAQAGVGVYWGDGDSYNTSEPLQGRQTNNRAEIEAARQGIEQARDRGYSKVEVNTDSRFLVDSATKWMPKWQQNDYTLSTGGPVKNRSDFERLDQTMQGMDVTWKHVPGHAGVHGNEQADRLATQGARKHRY